jgi:hypothetical protein
MIRVARRLAAGVFLANSVPHGAHALVGKSFLTPFADPPGSACRRPAQTSSGAG